MPSVRIDCFHQHMPEMRPDAVVVAMDVIRATTTAVSAAARGLRVYPAGSIEAAVRLAADLDRPLLAGELGGVMPYGFDLQNSPTAMEALNGSERPVILLSTSGTRLVAEAAARGVTYLTCLRNVTAQAAHLAAEGREVVALGADSRGEFREEDQLCAARLALALQREGYELADRATEEVCERWSAAGVEEIRAGRSATYLTDTGQEDDLRFVLEHVDDLSDVYVIDGGEVRVPSRA